MPNITIYLNEEEYLILMHLTEEQERKIKTDFKKSIMRYDIKEVSV